MKTYLRFLQSHSRQGLSVLLGFVLPIGFWITPWLPQWTVDWTERFWSCPSIRLVPWASVLCAVVITKTGWIRFLVAPVSALVRLVANGALFIFAAQAFGTRRPSLGEIVAGAFFFSLRELLLATGITIIAIYVTGRRRQLRGFNVSGQFSELNSSDRGLARQSVGE